MKRKSVDVSEKVSKQSVETVADAIRSGDRRALAQAITLIESSRADHRKEAVDLLEILVPYAGNSVRIGITGPPGAGKSTFIDAFGLQIIENESRVAVLSIDPTSAVTGGSILGDKTRMELLTQRQEAFIRPSPTGGAPGGVARRTPEAILLCEAARFDVVIVETVGTGQSETSVAEMTDMFILLLLPGSGDELQGIKRGVMELADLILVNKADGPMMPVAKQTAADYRFAVRMTHPRSEDWTTPVALCSALTGNGIREAWDTVCKHKDVLTRNGERAARRAAQARAWMWSETTECLKSALKDHPDVQKRLPELEAAVKSGQIPPTVAAQQLLDVFLGR